MNTIRATLSRSSSKKSLNEGLDECERHRTVTPNELSRYIMPTDVLMNPSDINAESDPINNTFEPNRNFSDSREKPPPQAENVFYPLNFSENVKNMTDSNLGTIILEMATKINRLTDKAKLKQENLIDLGQLCQDFNEEKESETYALKQKLDKSAETIQGKILSNRLNFHHIDSKITPPTVFSPIPTLTTSQKLKDAYLLFPKKRFDNTKNSGSITEFLDKFNLAHKRLMVSKDEFTELLLQLTTGEAHKHLKMFVDSGESLTAIFYRLFILYDTSPTIQKARALLNNLKANKSSTIESLEAKILELVNHSARQWSAPMRKNYIDIQACQSLINALPDKGATSSKKICEQQYSTLAAELQRWPTFSEFTLVLHPLKSSLNEDIRLNAENSYSKIQTYSYPANKFSRAPKTNWREKSSFQPKIHNLNFSNPRNRNLYQGQHPNYTRPTYVGNKNIPSQQNLYCSLCGGKDHKASFGCPKMRNNQGKIIMVTPSQRYCSACYDTKNVKLYHPENLCFNSTTQKK